MTSQNNRRSQGSGHWKQGSGFFKARTPTTTNNDDGMSKFSQNSTQNTGSTKHDNRWKKSPNTSKAPGFEDKENVDPIRSKPSACLFVASLNAAKTDDQLCVSVSNHFKQFGQVSNIKVLRDSANRPYAFVQYTCDEDAQNAIKEGHHSTLDGRRLRCEAAKVNRTLFVNFGVNVAGNQVIFRFRSLGDIESIVSATISGQINENKNQDSNCWFIKFVYRDDAIRAFANVSNDSNLAVEWAQNVENGVRAPKPSAQPSAFDRFSIFVGQINDQIGEQELRQRFSRHGQITDLEFVKRPAINGKCNNFAFITYRDEGSAAAAVEAENHSMLKDRTIHVQYKEYHERSVRKPKPRFESVSGMSPWLAPPPINVLKKTKQQHNNFHTDIPSEYYYVLEDGSPIGVTGSGTVRKITGSRVPGVPGIMGNPVMAPVMMPNTNPNINPNIGQNTTYSPTVPPTEHHQSHHAPTPSAKIPESIPPKPPGTNTETAGTIGSIDKENEPQLFSQLSPYSSKSSSFPNSMTNSIGEAYTIGSNNTSYKSTSVDKYQYFS